MSEVRHARARHLRDSYAVAERVLRVLLLITREPARWPRRRLADYFDVSERAIDRDLWLIRAWAAPVLRRKGGYIIEAYWTPPRPPAR